MDKYIEFLVDTIDNVSGEMIDIEREDDEWLYYKNDYGDCCKMKKSMEHLSFEYVHEDRWLDYVSPWDDDWDED